MPSKHAKRVLIVGGGPVGCFTALRLGQAGVDVDILERLPTTSDVPRACRYFGAVHFALNEAGMYKLIRGEGFMTKGLCWRKMPEDNGKGSKKLGTCIAAQPLCAPDETEFPIGAGLLNLTQGRLNALLMREALKTGHVQCHFNTELLSINENNKDGVSILARNVETGVEKEYNPIYLIGTDGARSASRKALGLPYPGHTWPERLVATNVYVMNEEVPLWPTHYFMDAINYGVTTPLEEIVVGKKTLWRYTFAASPDDTRPDEELMSYENIFKNYEVNMAGPRPLNVEVQARDVYRIHQRLAPTMRKGNCLLAGDAAHCNNPFGALGLNTGLLDADAVAETLIMILNEGRSDDILDVYSDERRKVFQFFVDPTSTQNKLRVHNNSVDNAVANDWYFRTLQNPTAEQIENLSKPYFEVWRTNMREKTKD